MKSRPASCPSPRWAAYLIVFISMSACSTLERRAPLAIQPEVENSPYALDVYADDPVAHWRMDGSVPGPIADDEAGATHLDKEHGGLALRGADIGGGAFAVELWVKGGRGAALSYTADGQTSFALEVGQGLAVQLFGERHDTGARLDAQRWHHLGLSWRSSDGLTMVTIDGQLVLRKKVAEGRTLPYEGILQTSGYAGSIDEVAAFEEFTYPSAWLHRVGVARGQAKHSTPEELAPVRLLLSDGHAGPLLAARWSPDGATVATVSADNSVRVWDLASGQTLRRYTGHTDEVASLVWSPDGTKLATTSVDRTVKVWDLESDAVLLTLSAPSEGGYGSRQAPLSTEAVTWSPDGTMLATAGFESERQVSVWDLKSGKVVHTLAGHLGRLWSVAWSPDGSRIATSSWDATAIVWDAATGESLHVLAGHADRLYAALWSPDSRTIATVGGGETRLWTASSGAHLRTIPSSDGLWAWSPDARTLASYGPDRSVTLWEPSTGRALRTMTPERPDQMFGPPGAQSLAWSPDASLIAAIDSGHRARVWHAKDGRVHQTLAGHTETLNALSFSPGGGRIVTASSDRSARVWEVSSGRSLRALSGQTDSVGQVSWSPDGTRIATPTQGKTARVWDLSSGRALPLLSGHTDRVWSLAWSPDGTKIATASKDKTARVWDPTTGRALLTLKGHEGEVLSLVWSPNGAMVATTSKDKTTGVWDLASGRLLHRLAPDELPQGSARRTSRTVSWSPDGTRIAVAGVNDEVARVWDVVSGQQVATLTGHSGKVLAVAWSPDGAKIATMSSDRTFALWDAATGLRLHALEGHTSALNAMAWSPDGSMFASSADCGTGRGRPSNDNLLRVWDAASGKTLHVLAGHDRSVYAVAWSPDGKRLATASKDQTAQVWEVATGRNLYTLNGHAGEVTSAAWSADGRLATSSIYDKTLRLWDLESAEHISLIASEDTWLNLSSDGYFAGSAHAGDLFAVAQGWRVYAYEQLATTRNRPDKIMAQLGAPAEFAELYKTLWLRRLSKLGLDHATLEEDFAPAPHVHLSQVSDPDEDGIVELQAVFKDKAGLAGYRVAVNGVPHETTELQPLSGKRERVRFEVPLSKGRQRVDVTALNTRGIESLRASLTLDHSGEGLPEARLFFLGFGVSDYLDDSLDLSFAHQDTMDLEEAFTASAGNYSEVLTQTFINEEVTEDALEEGASFLEDVTEHDTLIIFIAGHGMRAKDKARTYYYLDHDTELGALESTAIPFGEVEKLLYGSKARKKLFLLDTCESGEDLDAIAMQVDGPAKVEGLAARSVRGSKAFGMPTEGAADPAKTRLRKMILATLREHDRLILQDFSRRSGAMVLASSMGTEFSLESMGWENGAFTEELLNAIMSAVADANKDGVVDTQELVRHISKAVPDITGDAQHPSLQKDNPLQIFSLPVPE